MRCVLVQTLRRCKFRTGTEHVARRTWCEPGTMHQLDMQPRSGGFTLDASVPGEVNKCPSDFSVQGHNASDKAPPLVMGPAGAWVHPEP